MRQYCFYCCHCYRYIQQSIMGRLKQLLLVAVLLLALLLVVLSIRHTIRGW